MFGLAVHSMWLAYGRENDLKWINLQIIALQRLKLSGMAEPIQNSIHIHVKWRVKF